MRGAERRGSAPKPRQEALPPGPPPRAVALGTIHFGGAGRGPTRTSQRHGRPSPSHQPMDRFQRASPFDGGPGGRASWWVPGRSPAALGPAPGRDACPRCVRQGWPAAARWAAGQDNLAACLPDIPSCALIWRHGDRHETGRRPDGSRSRCRTGTSRGETFQFSTGFCVGQVFDRFHVGLRVSRSGRRMRGRVSVRPDHLVRRSNRLRRPNFATGGEGERYGEEQGESRRAPPSNPPGRLCLPGPPAKGEALCNLSIGWVHGRGPTVALQGHVSALSHHPTKMNGSKGHCPWRRSRRQSLLVGFRGEAPALCPAHASAASQRAASRATFAGAVPPKLVRDATEASTVSTENTSAVMPGSTPRMSSSVRSARPMPFCSAMPTSVPVM